MSNSFRPLNDRILLERVEPETKTAGGILIPDNAKKKSEEARVVAVGQGKILEDGKRKSMELKVGDKVVFGKWSGTEVKIDGKEFLLVKEDEVLAVFN